MSQKDIATLMTRSGSKSTDKLAVVMLGLANLPPHKMEKLKSIGITWQAVSARGEDIVAPNVFVEFHQ